MAPCFVPFFLTHNLTQDDDKLYLRKWTHWIWPMAPFSANAFDQWGQRHLICDKIRSPDGGTAWARKNDLRWRRSGIYGQTRTQCMTADAISYTLAFKEAFWALEPARVHWTGRLPQAGLQYGSFGLWAGPKHHQAHSTGSQVSERAPRGCPGRRAPAKGGSTGGLPVRRSCQTDAAGDPVSPAANGVVKKVMRLHDKPEQ